MTRDPLARRPRRARRADRGRVVKAAERQAFALAHPLGRADGDPADNGTTETRQP